MDGYTKVEDCLSGESGNSEFAYLVAFCVTASNIIPQETRIPLLRQDGVHTRYIKGGVKPGRSSNDLRPPSLSFGETSIIDFLNEGPPPGSDTQSTTFATSEANSDTTLKKDRVGSKFSNSIRKIFSPKQRSTESKHASLELLEAFKAPEAFDTKYRKHVNTSNGSDSTLSSTIAELWERDSTAPECYPAYVEAVGMAPHRSSGISDPRTHQQHDRAAIEQRNSSSKKETLPITPVQSNCSSGSAIGNSNPSPRGFPPNVTPGSGLPSGKMHGKVPPGTVRPVISNPVIKEHLSLENYPSISKEDIARLPKMLEPTMVNPGFNDSQLLYGQHHWPSSASFYPHDKNPDNGKVIGKSTSSYQLQGSFEAPMQQIPSLPKSQFQPTKTSGEGAPTPPENSVEYTLPELKYKKNGEVKKYADSDSIIQALHSVAFEEIYGGHASINRLAQPSTIEAALGEAPHGRGREDGKLCGLGISSNSPINSSGSGEDRQRQAYTDELFDLGNYTPVTPTSGSMTPQTPTDFLDLYSSFSKTPSEDDQLPEMNLREFKLCNTLPHIHEDGTAATHSPFDDLHGNGRAITIPYALGTPGCSTSGLLHDRAGRIGDDLEPIAIATSAMGKMQSITTKQVVKADHVASMRTFDDTFSGEKIYPGRGKLYVRGDSKIFRFQNGKTESLFLQRKNPRRIAWTVLYRRQHKKGISEEIAKKRTRRTVKQQRGIVGASLDVIKERRSQRPEARTAARQEAIKAGKEKKAEAESKKKSEKAKSAAGAARGQGGRMVSKQGAKGAPAKASGKVR
ncbi:MAG: hypothetical protein Q9186_003744 [Xanthomendoza sp. 1 TL-2023]